MTDAGITGVTTIAIPVADQEAALAFYRDALGFEVRLDAPLPQGGRWIMLAPPGSPVSVSLVPPGEGERAGIDTGIRFEATDAARTREELAGRGVQVGELLQWPGVPPMFEARDADGNRFAVIQGG
ncbi:MAG: VOC family protein [Leifsonia sp.]|uniref:VOC family protein n=1 Tax=Leifsonia sp. TaxID=1870902 RepID=UPI003F817E8C